MTNPKYRPAVLAIVAGAATDVVLDGEVPPPLALYGDPETLITVGGLASYVAWLASWVDPRCRECYRTPGPCEDGI